MRIMYEATAKQNKKMRNFADWRSKIFYLSLGKLITLMSWPFMVEKLVLVIIRGTPYFSR